MSGVRRHPLPPVHARTGDVRLTTSRSVPRSQPRTSIEPRDAALRIADRGGVPTIDDPHASCRNASAPRSLNGQASARHACALDPRPHRRSTSRQCLSNLRWDSQLARTARMFILGSARAALDPDGSLRWAAMVGPAGAQLRADSSGQQRARLLPSRSQRRAISPRRGSLAMRSRCSRGSIAALWKWPACARRRVNCHADNHQRAMRHLLFPVRDQVRRPDAARESLARPFFVSSPILAALPLHRDVYLAENRRSHPPERGRGTAHSGTKRRPRRIGRRPAGRLC